MYHRDYLIRMLQQFVMFLAQLAGLKKKDDPEILLVQLEGAFQQFTGFDKRILMAMAPEGILQLYSASGKTDANRLTITALLFKEEGDILKSIRDTVESKRFYEKALRLLELCPEREVDASLREHLAVREEIRSILKEF